MRPRFRWAFFAVSIAAIGFAVSWTMNWNSSSSGGIESLSAAAQGVPVPGDLEQPSLTPPPMPVEDNSAIIGGDSGAAGAPAGGQVLSQGPVHEAFANPMELNPQPGPVVKKRPPDVIKEIPPAQQPDGDNIVWIPGYWAWDDDRQDFIWVSGVLRAAPPGQTWVPGYWSEVDGGYQWTPGLWTGAAQQEVSYLPEPPQSLENGPSSPQPSENHFWIPGTYVYQNVNYVWRPGYWTVCRPNWIWIPAHYCWTPGGYVFVDGYWDYELTRRGCLFAPVYFPQPVYAQPAFVFTPSVVFNVGLFSDCLFVRPGFCHYYLGDYFGPTYASIGFSPWFSVTVGSRPRFDPLFTYYRWHNSLSDRNWLVHTQQHFDTLNRDAALRPPRTFAAEQQWLKNNPSARGGNMALVSPLRDVAKDPSKTDFKFHTVSMADRQALAAKGNELQQSSQQRLDFERKSTVTPLGAGGAGTATNSRGNLNFPKGTMAGTNPAGNGAVVDNKNLNSAGTPKFKLPTAASSKMALTDNSQQSQASSGNSQRGAFLNQQAGAAGGNTQGNQFSNNRFGGNSPGTGSGFGSRFDSSDKTLGNTQQDKSGGYSSTGGAAAGTNSQTQTRSSRPSLVQPGSGISQGNVYSGNSQGGQSLGQGNQVSGGQPSTRGLMYPGAGGAGGNPTFGNPNITNPSGRGNGGGAGGSGGGAGNNNNNKDDSNKKNKTSSLLYPHPYSYEAAKPSFVDVHDVLKSQQSAMQSTTLSASDQALEVNQPDLGDGKYQSRAAATNSSDKTAAADSKNSTAAKPKTFKPYTLPPLFRSNPNGDDYFRSPLLSGIEETKPTPQADDSDHQITGIPGSSTADDDALTRDLTGRDKGNPNAPSGYGSGVGSSTPAAPQKRPSLTTAVPNDSPTPNPGLTKYDYQTMVERGQSLSTPGPKQRSSYAASSYSSSGSSTMYQNNPGAYENNPEPSNPLSARESTASVGPGRSSGRTMYGPLGSPSSSAGSMPMGPLNSLPSADSSVPYSSGSFMPTNSLPTFQHFDLHLPKSTSKTPPPDPTQRTYDPNRGY